MAHCDSLSLDPGTLYLTDGGIETVLIFLSAISEACQAR